VEWFVTHLQGSDHIYGLLGGLYGDEVCSKSSDEVVPSTIVDLISGEGSILPILGPFSYGHSHLKVGQGSGNLLRVITVEVAV
jgi:hypothetical protein